MTSEGDNFFSRWSRRKVQVRSGEPLPAEPVTTHPPAAATPVAVAAAPAVAEPVPAEKKPEEAPPALTLDDVARLTPESDFSSFVARGVPANVRNAAVKKLFADPHFNVMDGLDIYIDDYSKPSPLSATEMAKMVGAQFLKLVDDPNEKRKPVETMPTDPTRQSAADPSQADATADTPDDHTENAPTEAPPLTASSADPTEPTAPQDDHPDLQLQPDHAPGPQGPGRGAG